jgi:hypothetical protein
MNRLAVFVVFFILAWFVPAWPVLLVIGVVWLIAKLQSGGGKEPPPDEGGEDRPEPPPSGGGGQRWTPFQRSARRESKPFFRGTKR